MRTQEVRLSQFVEAHLLTAPKCHDWNHTLRVLKNAIDLQKGEGGNLEVIRLSVLLHDIARPEELAAKGKICHAQVGSDLAREILTRFGYVDEMLIDQVTHCILCHRTRNGHVPQTLEAKIVFDADKLDSIGAIGIGRAFHFAGRFGAKVHNDKLAAIGSEAYSEEDTAYREYLVKLKHISKNLYTNSGKTLAKDRHDFMVRFFDQLNTETSS